MISWASKKLLNASLAIAFLAALTTVGLFNSPVSADAITGKNNDGLASQTERWLRLRAVTRCFDVNDVGKNSYNDVNNGAIFDSGSAAIGYLNPDGKVSCDGDAGEAFVRNSFDIIGFANPVSAFCSVQPMASRGSSDTKNTDNYDGCVNGSGDEFDMDSNAFDQGARQVSEFKEGYKKHATAPVSWSPTPAMMYYVYRQSLVEFCGAKLIGKYDPADENNIRADVRKLVVNDVDLATGDIIRNVYSLIRDQGDKVDDIYVNNDLQNVSNVTCSVMAEKTWDYDEDMAAYVKTYNTANPDDVGTGTVDGGGSNGSLEPVCSAGALGWIFCPLTEFISDATKMVAEILEERLVYPALTTSDQGKVIRTIWGTVLGIANVGLVIAFLIVIFSQATSIGLSSYGIKKILPRVVAAAILMNLSFFICAIAVDFANILGVSIKAIIENGIKTLPNSGVSEASYSWSTTVVAILALGLAVVTGAIALLLPVLVAAFIAVLTAFLVIAAREVLVTLLIIVAPIAFLAWILPNTEQWFTKWRKLFTTMLLMFPLVMLIFYGSLLLSNVILVSADGGADGTPDLMVNVIALGVLTVPLFSLPFIMKSAGGVLDRLGVMVNNRNKGLIDRSRKKGQELYNRGSYARGRAIRQQAKTEFRNKKFASRLSDAEKARTVNEALENKARELGYITSSGKADVSKLSNGERASAMAQWSNARSARRLAGGMAGMRTDLVERANRVDPTTGKPAAPFTNTMLGNQTDQRIVASPAAQAQASALLRAAQGQEAKAFSERVGSYISSYERGGSAGADTSAGGYLEQQYQEALTTNNHEQAAAVLTRLTNLGAGGRNRAVQMLATHAVTNHKMQDTITKSIMQDNYGDLVKTRGDAAKSSGFDGAGKWVTSGNLGKLGTAQLAVQDEKALYQDFTSIPVSEAAAIKADPNLWSTVQNAKSRAILDLRAGGTTSLPTSGLIDPSDPSSGDWSDLRS